MAKLRLYILLLQLSLCDFLTTRLLKSIDFQCSKDVGHKKKKIPKALLLVGGKGWVKRGDIS